MKCFSLLGLNGSLSLQTGSYCLLLWYHTWEITLMFFILSFRFEWKIKFADRKLLSVTMVSFMGDNSYVFYSLLGLNGSLSLQTGSYCLLLWYQTWEITLMFFILSFRFEWKIKFADRKLLSVTMVSFMGDNSYVFYSLLGLNGSLSLQTGSYCLLHQTMVLYSQMKIK